MSSRVRGRNAFETTLNGAISSGSTSILLTTASGLVGPGYLVLEPGVPAKREYIRFESVSTNTLNGVTRGLDGSAAGAQTHDSGTKIRAVAVHQWLDLIFTDIEALEAADTAHVGGTDISDHPEVTGVVRGFMSAADKTKLDGVATGAKADHGLLTGLADDDHTQYYNATRHTKTIHDALAIDHGSLTGLADDDHTQYLNDTRHTALAGDHVTNGDTHDHAGGDGAQIDHGGLGGLADDDHTQYLLASGTRAVAGNLDPDSDNARDLGDATNSWRRLYVHELWDETGTERLDLGEPTLLGNWTLAGDLLPDSTQVRDLGTNALAWAVGYINVVIGDGASAAAPTFRSNLATDCGVYFPGSDNMQFSAGGAARFGVTSTQIQAPQIHAATTGAAANVVVASTGSNQLLRSTSALRYKERVMPALNLADIELVPTRHFRPDDGRWRYGLIADWLGDQDELIGVFGEDGRIEDYDDRAVLAVIAAKLTRLEKAVL